MGRKPRYVLIEFCCSADSTIGKTAPPGALVIRCTGKKDNDNVLTERVMQQLLGAVQVCRESAIPVVLWSAIPCAGGSQWQVVNKARYGPTAKLQGHWKLFRQLWRAFQRIAGPALSNGGFVCNEWALRCAYWHDERVVHFLKAFFKSLVYGCLYGLRPVGPHAEDEYLGKAWRISCSGKAFAGSLERH